MKHIILTILTTLLLCGTVYGNPAIEALEDEMDLIRPDISQSVELLKQYSKLREIRESLLRQQKNDEVIRQWEKELLEEPCDSLFRGKYDCEKVRT